MNYETTLMRQILTNAKAQEIIDYVSQIYGDSYVGLWFFQAIGTVLEPGCDLSDALMLETSPATATLLLPYYEQEYGIQPDPTMTIEQRRNRIISTMQSKGACNPARLGSAISAALGGVPVEILENTGPNTFIVNIRAAVNSYAPAIAVIEAMKPAHLIYQIQGVVQESADADIDVALTMTRAELYAIRATNSKTVSLTPTIIEESLLKIRRENPITGVKTIEEVPQSSDGNGTVTLPTIKSTSDGDGTVTLNRRFITEEE